MPSTSGGTPAACRSTWSRGCADRLRERQGRKAEPTACIIDSQIVKCADTVGKATSGYHGGKKITGRGRHLIVDTEGWPLALAVTAASASDKAGARLVTARLIALFTTLKIMWADTGYNGRPLRDWMKATAGITLEIVARTSPHAFQVVKRRWVVERTFGWLMRYRRLARDYERTIDHHEAMVWWATVFIMTKRLTRYETGQPQPAALGRRTTPPRPASGFINRPPVPPRAPGDERAGGTVQASSTSRSIGQSMGGRGAALLQDLGEGADRNRPAAAAGRCRVPGDVSGRRYRS